MAEGNGAGAGDSPPGGSAGDSYYAPPDGGGKWLCDSYRTGRSRPYKLPDVRKTIGDSDKENVVPKKKDEGINEWLSARKWRSKNPPDFILGPKDIQKSSSTPRKKYPGDKVVIGRKDKIYQASVTLKKEKKYCCYDCQAWFDEESVYASTEVHLQRSGRHRQPRAVSPPSVWDIGFPEDYPD